MEILTKQFHPNLFIKYETIIAFYLDARRSDGPGVAAHFRGM